MTGWKAAGTFRLAVRAEEGGEYFRARALYLGVLELVPDHLPALHNLAVAELRRGEARRCLALTDRILGDSAMRQRIASGSWPALAYTLMYNRSLALTTLGNQAAAARDARNLAIRVLELSIEAEPAVSGIRKHRRGRTPRAEVAHGLVKQVELPTVVLLAGIILKRDAHPDEWRLAAKAMLAGDDGAPSRAQALEIVGSDELTPTSAAELQRYARANAYTNARTRYNLACFAGRILEALDKAEGEQGSSAGHRSSQADLRDRVFARALEDLDDALVDPSLLAWALDDPALKSVRGRPGWTSFLDTVRPPATSKDAGDSSGPADPAETKPEESER